MTGVASAPGSACAADGGAARRELLSDLARLADVEVAITALWSVARDVDRADVSIARVRALLVDTSAAAWPAESRVVIVAALGRLRHLIAKRPSEP